MKIYETSTWLINDDIEKLIIDALERQHDVKFHDATFNQNDHDALEGSQRRTSIRINIDAILIEHRTEVER